MIMALKPCVRQLGGVAQVWRCVSRSIAHQTYRITAGNTNHDINDAQKAAGPTSARLPRLRHTIPESYEKVEVSTAEWSYVERLLPLKSIPKPTGNPGEVMPSGWVVPSAKPGDYPYFVPRSANHMLPVYLLHKPILSKHVTSVKHVQGDIFALSEELREHLTQLLPSRKIINMRVHEPHQMIQIKGQFVTELKEFLLKKGF
nr:39S ribosomal protein L49, mitochondrial-like [Cherax quadricarinatus]